MDLSAGGPSHRARIRCGLSRRTRVEDSDSPGLESAAAHGARSRAQRKAACQLEEEDLARHKKKALKEGRTLVFVDESGLSQRPHRVRTWAPRGQTPVLQYSFNWKCLSAIAGITVWNFYFRLYPGSIKAAQIIAFLKHLRRHIRRKLLIIW